MLRGTDNDYENNYDGVTIFKKKKKKKFVDPWLIELHGSVLCENIGSIFTFFLCVSNDCFETPPSLLIVNAECKKGSRKVIYIYI